MRFLISIFFLMAVTAQAAEQSRKTEANQVVAIQDQSAVTAQGDAVLSGEDVTLKKSKDGRNEAEIPLNLDANKKAATEGNSIFRFLFSITVLGVLGGGAFYFIKKYSVPKGMKHQTQIKILQQHYLGPKKSLAIVRVAGESILIGVTDSNISLIKSLSLIDDEVPEEAPQSFSQVIGSSFLKGDKEQAVGSQNNAAKEANDDEDFAISGIKDIVSKRLKSMRTFQ